MAIAKPLQALPPIAPVSTRPLYQRLETLLTSGGDARLTLSGGCNAYGATPYPRPELLDFASSTASCLSERGYARAGAARAELLARSAAVGPEQAFQDCVDAARATLWRLLKIDDAEIVFSPSGTDAQLQALFLVREMLGGKLVSIVIGADQTGSGTVYTSMGRHFSASTARGLAVEKGADVEGLSDALDSVAIPFCANGKRRDSDELDRAIVAATEKSIAAGNKVLLQAMESSKLGWRGPSDACIDAIAARWPDDVRIVVDACQMRLGRRRLGRWLARGFLVLITGSKYFSGPPFSGALLVPDSRAREVDAIATVPPGLCQYGTCFDWPLRWPQIREALATDANHGQWLRWEAALEEMTAYYAMPAAFRDRVLGEFAAAMPRLLAASSHLELLEEPAQDNDDDEMRHRTIFAFSVRGGGDCALLYRAMRRDLTSLLPDDATTNERRIAARACQIGQPVALHAGAVLRMSASAAFVNKCWAADGVEAQIAKAAAVIEKLDWLISHPEILAKIA